MSKTVNDVTLFSNGIGHFRRTYEVPAEQEESITIPFKTDFIGDVAASLQVFGKVRLVEPPSFTPANSNATSLNIDQADATKSLLTQLSGALVTLSKSALNLGALSTNEGDDDKSLLSQREHIECHLVGVETRPEKTKDGVTQRDYVVYMQDGKVARIALDHLLSIQFNDDTVRTEIDKALKMNFQQIKPDSTLLDLKLTAKEATDAVIQYTIPVAAWKMRYAIREDDGKFTLEGAAIIDNNTDEDWDNFRISVVTGNPISFNTDIAEVVLPQRKYVKLVDDVVLGNVDVEEGSTMMGAVMPQAAAMRGGVARHAKMSVANYADFGMESCADMEALESAQYVAEAPGVESKEVGDFCVFTSKEPITILARKSAVVPMFTVPLSHAGVVLLYKETNHARRPYRAIKFRNETLDTLGKGKTVIYNEGVFSGECVLDTTKPGENRMLPHCLENGVKIVKEHKDNARRCTSIKVSEGVAINEILQLTTTGYTIDNKKDETFKLALEHRGTYGNGATIEFTGVEIAEQEKLSDGWRVYFEIGPKQKLELMSKETLIQHQEVHLGMETMLHWISTGIPIKDNPQVVVCADLQKKIDDLEEQRDELKDRKSDLSQQADRVRRNIEAVGEKGDVTNWIADLDATEREIRTIETITAPELKKQIADIREQLVAALQEIDLTWTDESPSAVEG